MYLPSGAGGTCSPPATLHRLQNPKWLLEVPKWPTGSWKVSPRFLSTYTNKFFDPSTPTMKKGRNGGETQETKKINEEVFSGH